MRVMDRGKESEGGDGKRMSSSRRALTGVCRQCWSSWGRSGYDSGLGCRLVVRLGLRLRLGLGLWLRAWCRVGLRCRARLGGRR